MKYRADIDGLRAMAVLAVVAYHAFPTRVPGGFVGVDVFFAISGYLISGLILEALAANRFSVTGFYARRARRIFPALALVLAAVFGAGWFLLFADDFAVVGRHIAGGAGFVANLVLWREAGYFDAAAETKPLLHLWSLGIEEQFYLLWPALLVLGWRRRIHPLVMSVTVLVASFLFSVWTVRVDRVEAFYSPATRLWELLLGGALASAAGAARPRGAWREAGAGAGLALILAGLLMISPDRVFPGLWVLLPTGGACLLIACGPEARVNRTLLSNPVLVWVGLISYPLYLWHWPLLAFARIAYASTPPASVRLALVAGSLALAWITFEVIEKPVRRGAAGWLAVPALCVAMTAVAAVGLSVQAAEGYVDRPVNRSDQAHFLQYYDRLHRRGLAEAYRAECDFMEWGTEAVRDAVSPSCTEPGERRTVFLWGDSYAQALSLGIRSVLPGDSRLAQVATSGCRPSFDDIDSAVPGGRCRRANTYAVERIRALRPAVVVVAQMARHEQTDWRLLADRILALGAARVVVVGPSPRWSPSLPEVVAGRYWGRRYDRVREGLDLTATAVDHTLGSVAFDGRRVAYVSLVDSLCDADGCLAVVAPGARDLIAVDSGHLSPKGSVFVVRRALAPYLAGE